MTKEHFIIDTLFLLIKRVRVRFKELNYEAYGISRSTAWRVMKKLQAIEVLGDEWTLTETFRQQLKQAMCEACPYPSWYEKHRKERRNERLRKALSQM